MTIDGTPLNVVLHNNPCTHLKFNHHYLVTADKNGLIRTWRQSNAWNQLKLLSCLTSYQGEVESMKIISDHVSILFKNGCFRIYQLSTGRVMYEKQDRDAARVVFYQFMTKDACMFVQANGKVIIYRFGQRKAGEKRVVEFADGFFDIVDIQFFGGIVAILDRRGRLTVFNKATNKGDSEHGYDTANPIVRITGASNPAWMEIMKVSASLIEVSICTKSSVLHSVSLTTCI